MSQGVGTAVVPIKSEEQIEAIYPSHCYTKCVWCDGDNKDCSHCDRGRVLPKNCDATRSTTLL